MTKEEKREELRKRLKIALAALRKATDDFCNRPKIKPINVKIK